MIAALTHRLTHEKLSRLLDDAIAEGADHNAWRLSDGAEVLRVGATLFVHEASGAVLAGVQGTGETTRDAVERLRAEAR